MNAATCFAEIAFALEDMHGVAVEGDRSDLTDDMAALLAAALRQGSAHLDALIIAAREPRA